MSLTEPTDTATAPLTRRERQRQATFTEIVDVSRRLLRETRTVSLRAVATEMGMTPPALYRYVDGYDELILLVAKTIFADVVETMRATVAKYDDDDPGAQMVSAATAFRQWALAHPDEFELIFASRETAGYKGRAAQEGGFEFSSMFSEIFLRVYDRYRFDLSEADALAPELIAGLEKARADGTLPCEFPGQPIGLVWIFMRCWARVYGTITLEVFGHIDQPMIDAGAMFAAMMDDNGRELNLGDDFDRLRTLIRTELTVSPG
jgi:AcrR family transcriptional regulator